MCVRGLRVLARFVCNGRLGEKMGVIRCVVRGGGGGVEGML